jgi:hypothetical protein
MITIRGVKISAGDRLYHTLGICGYLLIENPVAGGGSFFLPQTFD